MFNKKDNPRETTWSDVLLKEFLSSINSMTAVSGELSLYIRKRVTEIKFNSNESIDRHIGYKGFLAYPGLEDVYFALSYDKEETMNNQKFIGHLEILNGISDQDEPVPMIRGFIKYIEFFDTIDNVIRDVKMFDPRDPRIILNIHIDRSELHHIKPEYLFNIKIGIEFVNIYRPFNIA